MHGTAILTFYLVRFYDLEYSARNFAEKNLFLSTSKYDLMIIFQNISNLSFKIERFISSYKNKCTQNEG